MRFDTSAPILFVAVLTFERCGAFSINHAVRTSADITGLQAAPRRLEDNADGVLFVNEKCINCAACSHFAPDVFARSATDGHHIVRAQPDATNAPQLDRARAALSACPVAAIRVENSARLNHASKASGGSGEKLTQEDEELAKLLAINPKVNGLALPFPRPLLEDHGTSVWFLGAHNDKSFGATPYLVHGKAQDGKRVSVMVDTPKFSPASVRAVQSLLDNDDEESHFAAPDYLFLTHVDDTAHHLKWKEEFPSLKRIFHSGDLGPHNWLGDLTLEGVEVLLQGDDSNQAWNLDGEPLSIINLENLQQSSWPDDIAGDFIILHTPGHSPGSISLLYRSPDSGAVTLFTGDTYAFSRGHMSGFPRYGNDLRLQSETLTNTIGGTSNLWDVIAPGHGHTREYLSIPEEDRQMAKMDDIADAVEELKRFYR